MVRQLGFVEWMLVQNERMDLFQCESVAVVGQLAETGMIE